MNEDWPFDQEPAVAAITTGQVLEEGYPVLSVVHYSDDHSWGFTCGTTDNPDDGAVVDMACVLDLDPSLATIADLPLGWCAWRDDIESPWTRWQDDDC